MTFWRRTGVKGMQIIAVKTDKYSQHILEALELPDFESDFSLDSAADPERSEPTRAGIIRD
jgi:hypothetical protein